MDKQLYLVGLWTELPLNYTLKSIIYKEYPVVEIPATFLTDSTLRELSILSLFLRIDKSALNMNVELLGNCNVFDKSAGKIWQKQRKNKRLFGLLESNQMKKYRYPDKIFFSI